MPLGSTNSNVPRPPHKLDKYRDLIKVWYLDEGRSNKQICDSLKGQPYFCDVTQKQLEARLRLWGMRKNMKKADYEKINLEQVARLARNPHSQTEVCFRDKIVSPTILKKARQRYGYQPPDLIARMTGVVSIGHEAVEISRSDLSMEPDSRAVVRCRTPIHELDTYMSNLQAFQLETLPIAQFSQDLPHILDDYLIKVHSNTLIGDSFITEAEVNILTDNCALDTTRDGFEQQLRQTQYNGGFFADSRWEHDLNVFQELHYLLAEASRGGPIDHQLIISPTDTKSILKLLQFIVYRTSNNMFGSDGINYIINFVETYGFDGVIRCIIRQGGETAESFGRTFLQAIIKSNDPKNLRLARLLIDLGIKLPTSKLLEAFSRADLHIDTIQFLLDLMSKVYAQHSDRRRDPEIAFLGLLGHITEGPAKHPWPIDGEDFPRLPPYILFDHTWLEFITGILNTLLKIDSTEILTRIESILSKWLKSGAISRDWVSQYLMERPGHSQQDLPILELLLRLPEVQPILKTPQFLEAAIKWRNWNFFEASIASGANVNGRATATINTPLITAIIYSGGTYACRLTGIKIAKYLIDHGANTNLTVTIATHEMRGRDKCERVTLPDGITFVKSFFSSHYSDGRNGLSPLEMAILCRNPKMIELIMNSKMEQSSSYERLLIAAIIATSDARIYEGSALALSRLLDLNNESSLQKAFQIEGVIAGCLWANNYELLEKLACFPYYHNRIENELSLLLKYGHLGGDASNHLKLRTFDILTKKFSLSSTALRTLIRAFTMGYVRRHDLLNFYDDLDWPKYMFGGKTDVDRIWYRAKNFLDRTSTLVPGPDSSNISAVRHCLHWSLFRRLASNGCCDEERAKCLKATTSFTYLMEQFEQALLEYGYNHINFLCTYNVIHYWYDRLVCNSYYLSRLQQFIRDGLDLNAKGKDGKFLLLNCQLYHPGSYELLESIIGFGVLVYNPAAEKSPLLVAIKAGNSKAFKLLLANGGRKLINSPYRLKVGDLHDSVCRDRKCPETREQRCKPFVTPLVLAAAYGSLELVIILLAEGADVNFSTPQTTTALEAAVQNGRLDTVRLLLNAGATQAGKAWSWAQNGFPAISKMLKDHMDAKGITPEEPEVIHELDDDDYDVDDDDYDADDDDYDVYDAI